MLLSRAVLQGIVAGEIDLAFRRWTKPTVKAGGRLRTAVGELAIDAVDVVDPAALTEEDARRAGEPSLEALLARQPLKHDRPLYRVRVRFAGADPRVALRSSLDGVGEEAARLDERDVAVLRLIAAHPARLAGELAEIDGRERLAFKRHVRRLKERGLTESLQVGYRLSPRGTAVLAAVAGP